MKWCVGGVSRAWRGAQRHVPLPPFRGFYAGVIKQGGAWWGM